MTTYRLNGPNLMAAAAALGDTTLYSIGKRTGLSPANLKQAVKGAWCPSLSTVARLAGTYGIPMETLIAERP